MRTNYKKECERLKRIIMHLTEPKYIYDEAMIAENKRLKEENESLKKGKGNV